MEILEVFEEDVDLLPIPDEYADVNEQAAFQAAMDAKFFSGLSAPKFEASFVALAMTSSKVGSPVGSDVSTGPGSSSSSVLVDAARFSSSAAGRVPSFSVPLVSAERAAEPPANLRDRRGRLGLSVDTRKPKARASRWSKTPETSSAHHAANDDASGTPDAPGTFHLMAPRKSSSRLNVLEKSDSSTRVLPTRVADPEAAVADRKAAMADREAAADAKAERPSPRQGQNRCCIPFAPGKRGLKKS